ncbi:hypothetical protein [Helicobacter pylori]|uniref:hypothetical protein n=1 Tax=Helicobacter pylori TaxID=210 RepID=UPI00165AB1EA|nr:hypothetical protein [Helicobacter pylori]
MIIIKSVYRTHSFQTPFLDWYFKGLSSFQTLKKGFSYNAFNSTLFRRSLKLLASFKAPFSISV